MYYFDYLRYPLAGLVANEAVTNVYTCTTNQLITVGTSYNLCPPSVLQPNPNSVNPSMDAYLKCPLACGYDLLAQFGIDPTQQAMNEGLIWLFAFAFAIINAIILAKVNHISR